MGRDRVRRWWRLLLALVVGVWAFGAPPADPATAQAERGITVTPSSGLREGNIVQIELRGMADQVVSFLQCPASVELPPAGDGLALLDECRTDFRPRTITTSPAVEPFSVTAVVVPSGGDPPSSVVHCAARPGACVIVAWPLAPTGEPLVAPIDMVASPLRLWPDVADAGSTIQVFAGGESGSEVTLAQCARPVAETRAASRCGPGATVEIDASGLAVTEAVLAELLTTPAGTVDCVYRSCAMATFDPSGATLGATDFVVGPTHPLSVTVSPSPLQGLVEGQEVEVAVTGRPHLPLRVAQCDYPMAWPANVEAGPCQVLVELEPGDSPTEPRRVTVAVTRTFTGANARPVHCSLNDCWLVVAEAGGVEEFFYYYMSFATDPQVSLSPSSGLLDGQTMTLTGRDLYERAEYRVVRCQGVSEPVPLGDQCEESTTAPAVLTSATGDLEAALPAAQRFRTRTGRNRYCHDDCQVALVLAGEMAHVLDYDMAEGSLGVSPASGLEDGQPVTVTGSQLMSSYDGPPVWVFGSGQWSLVQCSRDVPAEPSLLEIFTRCAVLSPGGVPVPGSDLSTTVEVQARPTAILGEALDCTTAPDACVVVLARLEQDGSVSTHVAPLSFAS